MGFDASPGRYSGLGFFFSQDDPYCGIDLDQCLTPDGTVEGWAVDLVSELADTYRAKSCSGRGLHIICRAQLPGKGKKIEPQWAESKEARKPEIGIYDRGRFLALTGVPFGPPNQALTEHQVLIDALLCQTLAQQPPTRDVRDPLSDQEIISKASNAANGSKFQRLWAGDWRGYESQSEADLALCSILAFWAGPDRERLDGLFRQSGLVREKWTARGDYRSATLTTAISSAGATRNREPRGNEPELTPQELPDIWVSNRQLPEIVEDALDALRRSNSPPRYFIWGNSWARVSVSEPGAVKIEPLGENALRGALSRSARYFKTRAKGEDVGVAPPLEVVRDILALEPSVWGIPHLTGIAHAPFVRPDGSICFDEGYDPPTKLYLAPSAGLKLFTIADHPTPVDVEKSLAVVEDAMHDFPFVSSADRANAVAAMLTPLLRAAIDGPTPLALIDAPQPGTGKSLLAEMIAFIATGRPAPLTAAPHEPEEWRKKITTVLANAAPIAVFDNVNNKFASDALCIALTGCTYADRQLGTFQQINLPVRCTWIATGNNMQPSGDLPRRCYWIRLDARTSEPHRRTGFRHPDLRNWLRANREKIIAALLIMSRFWFDQGCPPPRSRQVMGSFEAWTNVIGGILDAAGVTGFLTNSDGKLREGDPEAESAEAWLECLGEIFHEPFKARDVASLLLNAEDTAGARLRDLLPESLGQEVSSRDCASLSNAVGCWFRARRNRRFGQQNIYIDMAGQESRVKVALWAVLRGASPACGG
jgi:hypothetical protein